MNRTRAERGAVSLLMVAVLAVGVALCVAIGMGSGSLVAQARVDAAADLSALAGVAGGPSAARTVALGSGADTIEVRGTAGGVVDVEVSLGRHVAVATAAPQGPSRGDGPAGGP